MILLLSLGLGSRRLSEELIFTLSLVPAYLVLWFTCTLNESSNSVSGNDMPLPWLIEPCCLFPFTPDILANSKVQHSVFVAESTTATETHWNHVQSLPGEQLFTPKRWCWSSFWAWRWHQVKVKGEGEENLCAETQTRFFWSYKNVTT